MPMDARKRKRGVRNVSTLTGQAPEQSVSLAADEDDAAQQPEKKRQQQRRQLFVRGLAPDTTTDALISHFSSEFPIKHGHVVIDSTTKKCKGIAFIAFADAEDAKRALEQLDESELLGRKIRLDFAESRNRAVDDTLPKDLQPKGKINKTALELKEKRKTTVVNGDARSTTKELIIRNLPWSIEEPDQLAKLFLSYGKVDVARLPKKGPKTMRGYGFVRMHKRANAAKAIEGVNGKVVDGLKLAVDWSVDQDTYKKSMASITDGNTGTTSGASEEEDDIAGVGHAIDDEMPSEDEDASDAHSDEDDMDLSSPASADEDDAGSPSAPNATTQLNNDDEDKSATLFLRNVPWTATDDDVFQHFRRLAPVRYARVVINSQTDQGRGTAFVAFHSAADAQRILRDAPTPSAPQPKKDASHTPHSVLQNDATDPTGDYTLNGRILSLVPAVTKSTATTLADTSLQKRTNDKRRLYLLSEGTIAPSSALYASLPPSEVAMRDASLSQRKTLLQKNPSLHLSLTRLSLRNIPRSLDTKALKALARTAIVGFAADAKAGTRARLSREELAREGPAMAEAERARKKAGKGIVRQAKIVDEAASGSKVGGGAGGRSRGYGFVEYHTHRAALMGLRWLNGHAIEGTGEEKSKRLIVEFAIENAQVVQRRGERVTKARKGTTGNEVVVDPKRGWGAGGKKERQRAAKKVEEELGKEVVDKNARRQRIINKKRAARREKKRAGKS